MKHRALLPAFFLGSLFSSTIVGAAGWQAQPQTPPARDTRAELPPPVGTASISGAVVVLGSGQPARRARVNISSTELRGGRSATTDEQGRFSFEGLPAGRYSLNASKPSHVPVSYGQRQPGAGRPGTAIQLTDGQKFEARLQIPRGGVITGTVLDEHTEATPGTQIRVMRYVIQGGQRTLQQAGNASTDDRGIYRVFGLQPGDYVVCATPRNNPVAETARLRVEVESLRRLADNLARTDAVQAQQALQRATLLQGQAGTEEPQSGYAPVCYPGTTTPSSASTVAVGVGEERAGVDFQLQLVSIGSVEGQVVSPNGASPQNVQVTLINSGMDMPGIGNNTARVDGNGRFRISNVAPGQYTLVARGTLSAPRPVEARVAGQPPVARVEPARLWAAADVSVDGRTPTSVMLSLQPGMTVSGHITFTGAIAPPSDVTRVRVTLTPMEIGAAARQISSPASGRVDAAGKFTIANVVPGKYRLSASGAGSGWFVESAIAGGVESLDYPFEVKPNQGVSGAVITFGDKQTELSGSVLDGKGQPATDYTIIVFPSDERYWTAGTRRLSTTRPATDGRFILRNLPPGDYQIAAVIDPEPGAWTDPAYLQQLEGASMKITLAPGEKKVQNLRMSAQ
jgi:protocatechuate 3,4-dioxygenase beta subunit